MSDQPQDELALVLRRISALSRASQPLEQPTHDVPVLTELYEGQDAFSAVEIEALLAPYFTEDIRAEQSEVDVVEPSALLPETVVSAQGAGIKFLLVEEEGAIVEDLLSDADSVAEQTTDSPPLLLARQEIAEAVMTDMQPLIAQAIQDALVKELGALAPRLSSEVESVLAERLRERVTQALKKD